MSPWRVLALALAAQCGFSLLDASLPALTGFLKADLGLSATTAGLAVSSIAFGKIFGAYAAGVAADRVGERRVLVLGGFVAAALVALAAASPIALLFPVLVLAGFASAAGTPAGGRLVLTAFPPERRGLALGIRQTGIPFGALLAAALLPWVAHAAGWRWSLLVASGVAVLAVVPLALTRLTRVEEPLLADGPPVPGPARNRNVVLLTIWSCLIVSGQYAVLAFLALDVHARAGLSLATGSLLVALANGTGIASRVAWGAISDRALARTGRKPLLLVLTATGLAGALLLLATPHAAPTWMLVAVAAFAGLGLIGYQGLWITMVAEAAGPYRVGAATGFAVAFTTASIALTPPLYGAVADAAGSYRAIWAALAVVLAFAFVPAVLIREP